MSFRVTVAEFLQFYVTTALYLMSYSTFAHTRLIYIYVQLDYTYLLT